jgi:glycine cleavage system regulatory protein
VHKYFGFSFSVSSVTLWATGIAKEIFTAMGMNIVDFGFDEHGDAMVILQMVPHLVDRILIDAVGQGVSQRSIRIEDLSKLAPANYLLSELGLGRVAAQRPDISAGIISTGLKQPFGQQILDRIQSTLERISKVGESRKDLAKLFEESLSNLDPAAEWRADMETKTEAALIRLDNLRGRHFVVEAPNQPGILRNILAILNDKHNIDMTALDSQVIRSPDGLEMARFEIGTTDENLDVDRLSADLNAIGVQIIQIPAK